MRSLLVVHYGEIGTKGSNRPVFEGYLRRSIESALSSLHAVSVKKSEQRYFVNLDRDELEAAKDGLAHTFGVAWYGEAETAPLEYGAMLETAKGLVGRAAGHTFRVTTRRSNKSFGMTSQEVNRRMGEDIVRSLGRRVDLDNPEVTLNLDVISDRAVVYVDRVKGLGGLPVGVTGRVVHLLSGGIDSPVAAWLMMKRGCRPIYLHFYVAPDAESVASSKILDIISVLARYGGRSDLVLIPFAPYQVATAGIPAEYEPTVFRRFMRMVAEKVASRLEVAAVSSGDNLAQVASQTLYNIVSADRGSLVPILRPVLGYDKEEIVALARRIGTYELSIRDYKDCCSIVSRHPRTRMPSEEVDACSERYDFDALAERSISAGSMVTYVPPAGPASIRRLSEVLSASQPGTEADAAGVTEVVR